MGIIEGLRYHASLLNRMMKTRMMLRANNSVIEFPFYITHVSNLHVGSNAVINKNASFHLGKNCHLYIGSGTRISEDFYVGGEDNYIYIGKNVTIAPRVYVAECDHRFEDVERPILGQGMVSKGAVSIDDDCWIGIGAYILPNVKIGKHSVIGANTVVVHDVPPYTVAVGNPCRLVKKYNFERKEWEMIKAHKQVTSNHTGTKN